MFADNYKYLTCMILFWFWQNQNQNFSFWQVKTPLQNQNKTQNRADQINTKREGKKGSDHTPSWAMRSTFRVSDGK